MDNPKYLLLKKFNYVHIAKDLESFANRALFYILKTTELMFHILFKKKL